MGAVGLNLGLVFMLVLFSAGCGAGDIGAPKASSGDLVGFSGGPPALLLDIAAPTANPAQATPPDAVVPAYTPTAIPIAVAPTVAGPTAIPIAVAPAVAGPTATPTTRPVRSDTARGVNADALLQSAKGSPFHWFGDDVYTWDRDRRIVMLRIPVVQSELKEIRELLGHWDGAVEDTPSTRSWVQQCARRSSDQSLGASDAVHGAVTAQSVHSCLGGLVHLAELFARYWWTETGVACLADAVTSHSLHGDAQPRPLAVCSSIGYDPAAPRPAGWLAQRCEAIVAANPNPRYPADPAQIGERLPSCWPPAIEIIEAHATEGVEIDLPDSPHDCFHAFLGYVWARQTGLEGRPPSDLAIGCRYRAFEAMP